MKNLKKLVAVLLVIASLMSMFAIFATASSDDEEEIVARMYIGHKPRPAALPFGILDGVDNQLSGHTWVYVENLTDHELTVGAYTLKKGKGVSIGTYGYLVNGDKGLYYNVEAYRYKKSDPSSYVYLSKEITQEQLDKVSKTILNNNIWSYALNCAYSATNIWNAAPGMPVFYMLIPPLHHMQILMNPNHGEGFKMIAAKESDCFKQVGSGSNATLIPADPKVPEGKVA